MKNRIEFNFYPDEGSQEHAIDLTFEVEPFLQLETFYQLCRCFAFCLGFPEETIDEVFGEGPHE